MKIVSLFLAVLLSFNNVAACPDQPVKKGDAATCEGVVVSKDKVEDAEINKLLVEKLTKRNELRDQQLGIMEKRLDLYVNQSDILARSQAQSDMTKYLYFGLGVIVTGLISYGAFQLAK